MEARPTLEEVNAALIECGERLRDLGPFGDLTPQGRELAAERARLRREYLRTLDGTTEDEAA